MVDINDILRHLIHGRPDVRHPRRATSLREDLSVFLARRVPETEMTKLTNRTESKSQIDTLVLSFLDDEGKGHSHWPRDPRERNYNGLVYDDPANAIQIKTLLFDLLFKMNLNRVNVQARQSTNQSVDPAAHGANASPTAETPPQHSKARFVANDAVSTTPQTAAPGPSVTGHPTTPASASNAVVGRMDPPRSVNTGQEASGSGTNTASRGVPMTDSPSTLAKNKRRQAENGEGSAKRRKANPRPDRATTPEVADALRDFANDEVPQDTDRSGTYPSRTPKRTSRHSGKQPVRPVTTPTPTVATASTSHDGIRRSETLIRCSIEPHEPVSPNNNAPVALMGPAQEVRSRDSRGLTPEARPLTEPTAQQTHTSFTGEDVPADNSDVRSGEESTSQTQVQGRVAGSGLGRLDLSFTVRTWDVEISAILKFRLQEDHQRWKAKYLDFSKAPAVDGDNGSEAVAE